MNNRSPQSNTVAHLILGLLLMIVFSYWFFGSVFAPGYAQKSVYENAELRFVNTAGVRVADYALKVKNNSFLIAPNAPKELQLSLEFTSSGMFTAKVQSQYPDWLCNPNDFNKARAYLRGGSANESVKLIRYESKDVLFSIAKGQRLKITVANSQNAECGRALVTFYKDNNKQTFIAGFCLLWALVLICCLLAGVSPYVASLGVITNILFIAADISLSAISISNLIVNTGFSVLMVSVLFTFACLPRSKLLSIVALGLCVALWIPPLAFIAYAWVFSAPMSGEAIHGAMQSYDSQILEFWQQFIGKKRTLYAGFLLILLYFCIRHINTQAAKTKLALTYALLFLLSGVAVIAGRLHASVMTNLIERSIIEYKWEIAAFKQIADQRESVATHALRDPAHADDTTVIVFGESVNKKFMSAYGYVKNTTPLLDQRISAGETILYKNAYSNHSHSNPTMSFILTQANQYNEKTWLESPSVFNYARAASVETHWLTNHRLLGGWSNHITTVISEADRLKTINFKIGIGLASSNYDDALTPLFKNAIAKHPNQLTFLHLYNSHSLYCNRYPDDAKMFPLELPSAIYGRIEQIRNTSTGLLSCYVNTIHYTDVVLEQLIVELESKKNPSVLVYVADHSEEPIDQRTHNSDLFTYDMINIPFFVWANDAWRAKHPEKWQNIQNNKNAVFTNDLMFESVLGVAGITSPSIDKSRDVSSADYQSLSNPLTLHGRVNINDAENWNYWQSQNGEFASALGTELVAANVESLGQAYSALTYGIQKLHVNAQFSKDGGIQIVSPSDSSPITELAEFVDSISKRGFKSLLISFSGEASKAALEVIAKLQKESAIFLDAVSNKPSRLVLLSSPSFKAQLTSLSVLDKDKDIWVSFKSRYTDLAPVPKWGEQVVSKDK